MRITNPKLAGLAPAWRRYHGFSVLFDTPGTVAGPGIVALEDLTIVDAAAQRLYDELGALLADADLGDMRRRHGFCALPRHSYHVTVCDGPNEHDLAAEEITPPPAITTVLEGLPASAARIATVLRCLRDPHLPRVIAANPITFAATGVALHDHALVARLEPVDADARSALSRVLRARRALAEDLRAEVGWRVRPWRPHVTLGYFANRDASAGAASTLARWDRALASQRATPIRFSSAAVYAFTDMVSFHRLGPSA